MALEDLLFTKPLLCSLQSELMQLAHVSAH